MELINYLKTIDSPTLSNAIEVLNVRPRSEGFTPLQIRCLFPELGRMCGYAVTAQVETVTRAAPLDKDAYQSLFTAIHQSPKPAVVVLQEIGGHPDLAAHAGEIMATLFTRLGAVGLVSDCAVRDIPEIRGIGLQCFARGTLASHAHFRIVRAGVPVHVCGMAVRPGDVLHGDENGLLAIPQCEAETLQKAVDQIRSRERKLLEFVRGGTFTVEALHDRFFE